MHVFHIRGLSGILMVLLLVLAALAVLVALPSSFMMVLWNAVIFEGAHGPEINLLQGFLLWGFVAVMIKMIFKPEIKLQFQQVRPTGKTEKPDALKSQAEPTAETPASETASNMDSHQEQN